MEARTRLGSLNAGSQCGDAKFAVFHAQGNPITNVQPVGLGHIASDEVRAALHQVGNEGNVTGQPVKAGNQQGSAALPALFKGGKQLRPVRVSASALDLSELGHELATIDLAGDGLTLRVKAQPARALAVGRNTVIGNEISHGSASIVTPAVSQLPFVQILNVGLDLYRLTFWGSTHLTNIRLIGLDLRFQKSSELSSLWSASGTGILRKPKGKITPKFTYLLFHV